MEILKPTRGQAGVAGRPIHAIARHQARRGRHAFILAENGSNDRKITVQIPKEWQQ